MLHGCMHGKRQDPPRARCAVPFALPVGREGPGEGRGGVGKEGLPAPDLAAEQEAAPAGGRLLRFPPDRRAVIIKATQL